MCAGPVKRGSTNFWVFKFSTELQSRISWHRSSVFINLCCEETMSFGNLLYIQINRGEVDDRSGLTTAHLDAFDMFLVWAFGAVFLHFLCACSLLILNYWRNVALMSESETPVGFEYCNTTIKCEKSLCSSQDYNNDHRSVSCQQPPSLRRLTACLTHYYGSLYATARGNIIYFHSERLPAGKAASENVIFQTSQSQICYQPVISWKAVF